MSVNKIINEDEQILIFKYNQALNRVICPKCSSEILYFDEYCYNCGNKLSKSKTLYIPSLNTAKKNKNNHKKELNLKYASVTLLRQIMYNPLFDDKDNYLIKTFKNISFYDIRKNLINEGLIEVLTGREKIKSGLKFASEEYLDKVISQKNLHQGISKADKISIIINNLTEAELDAMVENYYVVTPKGKEFYENNKYCQLYSLVFYDFDIEYYENEYNNSNDELKDFGIKLLNKSVDEVIQSLKWQSYSDILYKYANIYDLFDEYDNTLKYVLGHFICEINPFSNNKIKNSIEISLNLRNKMIYSISKAEMNYDSFMKLVDQTCAEIRIPKNFIKNDELKVLLEELFDKDTTLNDINIHLNELIRIDGINTDNLVYNNFEEQEKVIEELENSISN